MLRKLSRCLNQIGERKGIFIGETVWLQALEIGVIGSLLAVVVTISSLLGDKQGITKIPREDMEESYDVTLEASDENGEKSEVILTVPKRQYSQKEIETWFSKGEKTIQTLILGENESLDHVESPLELVDQIPGTKVEVTWATSDTSLIDWNGEIGSNVPQKGAEVTLYVTFQCQEQMKEFELQVVVFPADYAKTHWEEQLQESFQELNEGNSGDTLKLPDKVNGTTVIWKYPRQMTGVMVFLTALLLMLVLIVGKQQEQKNLEEKRKEQMLTDYPEILSKVTLLLHAGMNTRKALAKVALDYRKSRKEPRAAYEEIVATYLEMEQGVSESEAYEHLGKRCGLPSYKTFATLLEQNLKKGNRELLEMMEREAIAAFENRKRRARILGEKAGTKLLGPMMCMLLIVFVILLLPAGISFME